MSKPAASQPRFKRVVLKLSGEALQGEGHQNISPAIVKDIANRPPARLTLVAGDLNTFGPPRPQLWRKIRATAHDAGLIELTHGLRRTHWTAQKLDAIYAAGDVPSKHRAWTLSVRASDHLPVFAELR